jgi:pyrimidine 5'-nucleotidase
MNYIFQNARFSLKTGTITMTDALMFAASAAAAYMYTNKNQLQLSLLDKTSLNANELICLVQPDNTTIFGGGLRAEMRLLNLWHRATYVLVKHQASHVGQFEDTYVLVQKRSMLKDYCPGKLDPTPGGVVGYGETYEQNAEREIKEEMNIDATLEHLFTFPYEDEHVRVWGDFYVCTYCGSLNDLELERDEVEQIMRMSLSELRERMECQPEDFMPDSLYAMKLYLQRNDDLRVNRRLLGNNYSSGHLDDYKERPKPQAIFFDCDDCLYFDNWRTANLLTARIDNWCCAHGLKPGQAYELYKQYGTALRGLLAEGYLEDKEEAIDEFLWNVHDLPISDLLEQDDELRAILLSIDPSIPKYIFTASIADHARRCIQALGIEDLFVDIIDSKMCNFESKHAEHSFRVAMNVAGVQIPECCLFFDDNLANIHAARKIGWRSILVGRVGRDSGLLITSEHAELEVDKIHDIRKVLPELFGRSDNSTSFGSASASSCGSYVAL